MIRVRIMGLLAGLVISTAAVAFQEQQAPAAGQAAQVEQSAPAAAAVPVSADAPASIKGTPVRIPGLGTLGVIPKMDFGLELLYGAAESKRNDPSKTENDDVLVGGRIKHKF